jgi:hypothetical protein
MNTYTISTPRMLPYFVGYRDLGRWCYDLFAPDIEFVVGMWRDVARENDSVRIWRTS